MSEHIPVDKKKLIKSLLINFVSLLIFSVYASWFLNVGFGAIIMAYVTFVLLCLGAYALCLIVVILVQMRRKLEKE